VIVTIGSCNQILARLVWVITRCIEIHWQQAGPRYHIMLNVRQETQMLLEQICAKVISDSSGLVLFQITTRVEESVRKLGCRT
jgi:hypothetical protein